MHLYCPGFNRVILYDHPTPTCWLCKEAAHTHTMPPPPGAIQKALDILRDMWLACKGVRDWDKRDWSSSMFRAEKEAFARMQAQGDYLKALLKEVSHE